MELSWKDYKIAYTEGLTGHTVTDTVKSLSAGNCINESISGSSTSHLATIVSNDKTTKYSYTASVAERGSNNIKKYDKSSILGKNARQRYTVKTVGTIKGQFRNN